MPREYVTDEELEKVEKELNIPKHVVTARLYKYKPAWSKERALSTPYREKAKHSKWSKENGVTNNAFHHRKMYGWTPEEAAVMPKDKREAARLILSLQEEVKWLRIENRKLKRYEKGMRA